MNCLLDFFSQDWFQKIFIWLSQSYIEVIATITGLLYLYYSIRAQNILWLFGIISSGIYVYITLVSKIYADMSIYIYYVVVGVYGWVHWSGKDVKQEKELLITSTNRVEAIFLGAITISLFFIISIILNKYTDSSIPYLDSLTTSGAITATWMLTRKRLEHWLMWIVINGISIGLYMYKGLYPTSGLYLVYTIFSVIGYFEWKRKCQIQTQLL